MDNSRTSNSIKNIVTAFVNQGLVTILTFVTRTILVTQLGAEYVGVNGLFTNVISMLSLAELGIGLAIPYSLYKPLAEKDSRKITALMQLYSKIYTVIGIFVLLVGSCLTPFLSYLVKDMPDIANLQLIYLLFVFNSGVSYFFSYKSLLISSDQKSYVIANIQNVISILLAVTQCLALIITKNFIAYLLCNTLLTVAKNLIISYQCDRRYPYIKNRTKEKLNREEIKEIKTNVFAVCLYRVGTVLLNGTDSLFISKFIGVAATGFYSNYTMVTNALSSILSKVSGLNASIGNASAVESKEYNETLFRRLDFINYWIYGTCSVTLLALFNPFIRVWIGAEYQLDQMTAWAMTMNFYTLGMLNINSAYRNAYGLFRYGKLRPLIMSIINIVLDFILVIHMGVFGVVVATLIARTVTSVWYDPYIVYKHGFQCSPKKYFITYAIRFVIVNVLGIIALKVIECINIQSWISWILAGGSVFILVNVLFFTFYCRTDEFAYAKQKLVSLVKGKLTKKK